MDPQLQCIEHSTLSNAPELTLMRINLSKDYITQEKDLAVIQYSISI